VALDRTGFTVEDRNRAEGVYFVRYVPPSEVDGQAKPGFFSRMFSRTKTPDVAPARYRIVVASTDNATSVRVLNDKGEPEASTTAQRIVQILADDLK
jgi:outer membrane protein assembly factor BamC